MAYQAGMTEPATIVPVVVTAPLDGPFDYHADGPAPPPGTFVTVPFGHRESVGVVWDYAGSKRAAPNKIKNLGTILQAPPMPPNLRRLIDHAASQTLTPRGSLLKLAIPVPAALETPPSKPGFRRTAQPADRTSLSKPQNRVLDYLADGAPRLQAAITKATKAPAAALRALADMGLLTACWIEDRLSKPARVPPIIPELSGPQRQSADRLLGMLAADYDGPPVLLLEGVPGSGKTEVYFEAIAECLQRGQQILVLLPEIALSAAWMQRFQARFGTSPVVWHSALTSKQRLLTWQAIARGDVPVVVGARSALFLPLTKLGLIVVDEEHDASFKQEDGAIYHARDLAEARAGIEGCPIVLASATPSIETLVRADDGQIAHTLLPGRYGGAAMPLIRTIDLRKDKPPRGGFLSPTVRESLQATLAAGAQSLIFLNRRGYAPLTLCRSCGYRLQCPSCSAWLVSHRFKRRLMCHHCGYSIDQPDFCPDCGSVDTLAASGPGVERLADEIKALMPNARLAILTSDQPSTKELPQFLQAMAEGGIDILLGTQIIAKGHHFPKLTNVIVADADLGLAGGDLRAAERSFQLLYQVAGRAGRALLKGQVLIQTHLPDHPVIQALAAGDKDQFYRVEMGEREAVGMPPYGRLAGLIIAGPDAPQVQEQARKIARLAPENPTVQVLGPAPAPLSLLRGRYRERLLVKANTDTDLPAYLRTWLGPIRLPSKVHLAIDVDPISFL